jgi:hypothetical protein
MKDSREKPQPDDKVRKHPKQRKSVSALTSSGLYQEASNRCSFSCVGNGAVPQIHHLDGDPSNDKIENLIAVCGNWHFEITFG